MNSATNPMPRLLPWPSPDGNPCYLVTDNGGGYLSRLADDLEAAQLGIGADVLGLARKVLDDPTSPYTEVRYAGLRLAECLSDALRPAPAGARGPGEPGRRSAELAGRLDSTGAWRLEAP